MSLPDHLPDATPAELLREFVGARSGEAFAELVRRYAGLVTGTAARVSGSRETAEDVAQEVFALLARKASAVDAASLGGWLHRVAVRRATAARRRSDARAQRELAAFMNTEMFSEKAPDPQWAEVLPVLDRALDSLPAEDRAVVVLRYYEQLSWHEIASRLPLTAEAARKRTHRALERLGRTLKARGFSTTAAALAAGLAAQWKAEAAGTVSPQLATLALTKSGTLPARAILTTTLATMSRARWAGFGAAAACVTAGSLALRPLLHSSEKEGPSQKTAKPVVESIAAAPPAPAGGASPANGAQPDLDDALLRALKIDLRSVGRVKNVKEIYPNGKKPKREEAHSLGRSLIMGDRGAASLYMWWWPEENQYAFAFGDSDTTGCYGPFTGNPVTNHDLPPYLLASLEGREPRFLALGGTIVVSFVSSSDASLRRYGWEILAALEKPLLQVTHQLTHQFPADAEKHLQEDTESPDPALREIMARVHEKLAAAASYYESCKEELPAESYQPVTDEDPASAAGLSWSPARDGLRAALIMPKKVKHGEPVTLSWALQNTGDKPVRVFFAGEGRPGMRWKGPEGSMNTTMFRHEVQNQQHRYIVQSGQCLRVSLSSPITFVEKGPGSSREFPVLRGPLKITARYSFPGLRSIDDAKQKVIYPARGEYEGTLESETTVEVE